jgi:transcriptional regulator with XRE-family HTH domain
MKTDFPTDPSVTDAKVLGKAVRACRTEAGLTLVEAAMVIGVAKQTLSDMENGMPSVKLGTALKIANDLGVRIFVLGGKDLDELKKVLPVLAK